MMVMLIMMFDRMIFLLLLDSGLEGFGIRLWLHLIISDEGISIEWDHRTVLSNDNVVTNGGI